MAIIMYLGRDVKEYTEISQKKIEEYMEAGRIRCDVCAQVMSLHSKYERGVRDTGEKIEINIAYCKKCNKWHALLPDFLTPYKQYSCVEIESVIIDSATQTTIKIDTEASESSVRRWISQIGDRLKMAVGILKYIFMQMGRSISEIRIDTGGIYSELEQVLEMAPEAVKHSNKLGLANIWLARHNRKELI